MFFLSDKVIQIPADSLVIALVAVIAVLILIIIYLLLRGRGAVENQVAANAAKVAPPVAAESVDGEIAAVIAAAVAMYLEEKGENTSAVSAPFRIASVKRIR